MQIKIWGSGPKKRTDKHFVQRFFFVFSAFDLLPRKITNGRNVQFFNLDMPLLKKKEILNATMYVHLPRAPKHGDASVWIDTHKLTVNTLGDTVSKRTGSTHATLDANYGGWVNINVTEIVREWIEHRATNFGLELKVKTGESNLIEIPIPPRNPLEARGNNVSIYIEFFRFFPDFFSNFFLNFPIFFSFFLLLDFFRIFFVFFSEFSDFF